MEQNPHLALNPVMRGATLDDAKLVVYAVHGRTQSPEFMSDLADRISLPDLAWMMPAAAGSSWYPLGFMEDIQRNQPHLDDALQTVASHLAFLAEQGVGSDRIVLLGFSQGACLLSEFLLRVQTRYAAAVLHTGGYLGPVEHTWPAAAEPGLTGMSVLMAAAAEDIWVPLHRITATAHALSDAGAEVALTTYEEKEHHINDDSVANIHRLLNRLATAADVYQRSP